jgi:hypothetical protein
MDMKRGVVICRTRGAGSAGDSTALAQHFGKTRIVPNWAPGDPLPPNALAFTEILGIDGAVPFYEAMREVAK